MYPPNYVLYGHFSNPPPLVTYCPLTIAHLTSCYIELPVHTYSLLCLWRPCFLHLCEPQMTNMHWRSKRFVPMSWMWKQVRCGPSKKINRYTDTPPEVESHTCPVRNSTMWQGQGDGGWDWKKDNMEEVSVCVCLREKLFGENLKGLRNTAWVPQIYLLLSYLTLCVSIWVGAQDLFWWRSVDFFPSSAWEKAAAFRWGEDFGLGLRLCSDWVRADTGSSFLCRDYEKTCHRESAQRMTEVRKAPTLSCEVTGDFYFVKFRI